MPFGGTIVERVTEGLTSLRGNPWRIPLVVLAFLIGSVVAFPITVLIATTILTLGPGVGFICSAVGTLLGGAASYGVGRFLGEKPLRRVFGKYLDRIDRKLEGKGIITVALMRKVPIAPFTIVNMIMGATGFRFRDFFAGTALGMIPGIAAFAVLGDRLAQVWNHPTPLNVTLVVGAVALWIGVILGMQKLVNHFTGKKSAKKDPATK